MNSQLILHREKITVYFNYTEHMNTLRAQNAEFLLLNVAVHVVDTSLHRKTNLLKIITSFVGTLT